MSISNPRIVGTLALLGAVAWCGWLWLSPARGVGYSNGQRILAPDATLRYASWGEPEPSAGLPDGIDARAALSADGRWLVWAQENPMATGASSRDLFIAELRDGRAGQPAALTALSSEADESSPAFGGEWLYFGSDRAGGVGGHDLWRARFSDGVVQGPEAVPGPANTPGDEFDPAPLSSGETIVFVADRDGAGFDLHAAPLRAGLSERLSALCSPADERDPIFTQDDRALVFASRRAGGLGGFDLYRAGRFDASFGQLEPLTPLNSADDERAPRPESDDLALGFLRSSAVGGSSLLHAPAVELFLTPRDPIGWMEWLALAGLLVLALLALLVRRFPELDRIYKCALVSVLAHLLLLWWFHEVWLNVGAVDREHRREPIRVRLADREPRIVALRTPPVEPLLPALEPMPRPADQRLQRADVAARPASNALEKPRAEALTARASETAPAREESARPPVAQPGAREALSVPAPAATPATQPAQLALPLPASGLAMTPTREAPQRLESRSTAGLLSSSMESVAKSAPAALAQPAREATAANPSAVSSMALRDAAPSLQEANPAPAVSLDSLAAVGAPSATSRSLGAPSRQAQSRSLGSPAASPRSSSVARAAPEPATASAPSARGSAAPAAAKSNAPEAFQRRDQALAAAGSLARSAAPASGLDLGELAAGELGRARSTGLEAGPERAERVLDRSAIAPERGPRGESVASRAPEVVADGARSTRSSGLAPTSASGSPSRAAMEQAFGTSTEVAVSASAAPALALGAPALEGLASSNRFASPSAGPERATSAAPLQVPTAPAAQVGASLASRARSPVPGLPRASQTAGEPSPSHVERSVGLADAADSVARPAAPRPADIGREWLPGLAPAPAESGSEVRGSGVGPTRAENPATPHAPAQLADGGASLARAPEPPSEAEPRPAKSDWDSTPYQNRSGAEKARALKLYGGSERTEAAVARGLAYLARIQRSTGAWGDVAAFDEKYGRVAIGKTALCTLAFLGAGHTPNSASEHSAVVARALEFLLEVQDEASGHFGEASAYDHGIATYAVAECFALTKDQRLRAALERALAHVLAMQSRRDDARFRGGWGYYFADGSLYDPWPRTSITAWQVMAVESARLSGLEVPDQAFDEARTFLTNAHDPELGAYRYSHEPERLNSGYPTLPASTPAALFALALLGEDIAGEAHAEAREYTLSRAPDGYRYTGEEDFVRLARGNPYFWYYGTLAMFRVGGSQWQRWNIALQESLLPAQARDGSWPAIDAYARYARDSGSDRSYTTAMCVLSLEIYYRYYLPLLKVR